jgi:hypothetical protein
MINIMIQSIAGWLVGMLFGTIIICIVGRVIVIIRDRMVNLELNDIRTEHNKKIKKLQNEYNKIRSQFIQTLGRYRKKITKMEVTQDVQANK